MAIYKEIWILLGPFYKDYKYMDIGLFCKDYKKALRLITYTEAVFSENVSKGFKVMTTQSLTARKKRPIHVT